MRYSETDAKSHKIEIYYLQVILDCVYENEFSGNNNQMLYGTKYDQTFE